MPWPCSEKSGRWATTQAAGAARRGRPGGGRCADDRVDGGVGGLWATVPIAQYGPCGRRPQTAAGRRELADATGARGWGPARAPRCPPQPLRPLVCQAMLTMARRCAGVGRRPSLACAVRGRGAADAKRLQRRRCAHDHSVRARDASAVHQAVGASQSGQGGCLVRHGDTHTQCVSPRRCSSDAPYFWGPPLLRSYFSWAWSPSRRPSPQSLPQALHPFRRPEPWRPSRISWRPARPPRATSQAALTSSHWVRRAPSRARTAVGAAHGSLTHNACFPRTKLCLWVDIASASPPCPASRSGPRCPWVLQGQQQ